MSFEKEFEEKWKKKYRGWDELGVCDWYLYTIDIMYKIDN